MEEKINVIFASDNNYVPFLLISIASLLENEHNFKSVNLYILDDGISNENKGRINKLVNNYPASISFFKTKKLEEMDFNVLCLERNFECMKHTWS